jgi:uncharacterized repeat protein (TIGR01451 family)
MKKGLLFLIVCLMATHLYSQEWIGVTQQTPTVPTATLISETEQATELCFTLGGFYKEEVNTPKGLQYIITVPKMASMLEEGAPDLPLFAIPVLIDDMAAIEVQVKEAKYQDFEGIEIAPSKGNFGREIDPEDVPFRYGDVYNQNSFFPGTQAQLDQPYILRDFRAQNILVYPFAYNPITKTLRVYTQLTLSMRKTGEKGDNPKLSQKSSQMKLSPETDAMYQHRFVNYRDRATKYTFIPDEGELLVICPDQYLDAMQPFVAWKNASGRPTTMVSLSDIGGNDMDQIKSFILSRYNDPNENLCYVLLVGDYYDITPKALNGGRSDIWFGQLEGEDYYPEVFVGRFSVGNVADVENQVAKVIYYERDIMANADWLSKGIGIGSTEGAGSGHNGGESDCQHIDYIRDTLMHYTYSEVSQHYQGVGAGTNASMLSQDFNAGAGICNYCNHGTQTGWYVGSFTNGQVNALVNDYKWPFIWSTACYNGQFDVNCFAEAWMRATNNSTGAPTGAIGGMFSWTNQPWQPPMTGQDEMVDILCEWRSADQFHHTLAGASLNGNMKILDLHPSDQGKTHNTWILFGDPSLTLRTDTPTELNVSCQPEVIFLGQTELIVSADADYALATLSFNGEILASTPIVNGEVTITFPEQTITGTAQLVVTSFNKVTEVKDIAIIPANGAFLSYESFSINDANGQADYGETVGFDVTIKNIGNETANNVQVTLSTDSPFVEITNGTAFIPSIPASEEYTITNSFEVAVNEMITEGSQVGFILTCTDGTDTWTSSFRMVLHAPQLTLTEFRPLHTTYPGQNGDLLITVKNTGTSDAHNAIVQLFSSSTELVFNPTQYSIGEIPAGGTATATASFSSSSNIPNGSNYEVYYHLAAAPYTFGGTQSLNIGPIKETFETGDFSAFPWESLGPAQWYVDNSTSNTGTFSARTGVIENSNLTALQVDVEVLEDGVISFYVKTCTEADKDKLTFYIDSDPETTWSGVTDWHRATYEVSAGTHRFRWIYLKDGSGSYGDDCCWIDDVQFPATHTVILLPPLELDAQVNENEVTLTWQAQNANDSYLIRRNGTPISTQNETTFTELLNIGTYTYSVTAMSNEGQLSEPAFATVEITVMGIDSIENTICLFPNPTHNWLNINLGQPFSYILFNNIGQLIREGKAEEDTVIDCRTLPQGIYILQIATKTQVSTKKIIVD